MSTAELDAAVQRVTDQLDRLLAVRDPLTCGPEEFFAAQFDAGLALVQLPEGEGGLGVSPKLQRLVDERMRHAGAKSALMRNPIGVGMGMPTLHLHGTPEQRRRYLRPCFTCEEIWCQLFSEPGAGSDLAGLACRAVQDGDTWVVNGQKVWTSLAHVAGVGMLLARTDAETAKHKGLTLFLVDMCSPGVHVRPLRQITGESEFDEVFLDDVRVPDAARLGGVGEGWKVALTTLMNERVLLSGSGAGASTVGGSRVEKLIALARETGAWDDPLRRDALVRRYVESQVIRATNLRARARRAAGRPGAEGSITKLSQGLFNRRLQELAVDVLGTSAVAWAQDAERAPEVVRGFLRAQANTIEGGTTNIQRTILGERVLGLPREPGPSRDTPWRELPRNG